MQISYTFNAQEHILFGAIGKTRNAKAESNKNLQGPTLRFVLPAANDNKMVLTREGENGTSSTYTLQYVNPKFSAPAPKILNM